MGTIVFVDGLTHSDHDLTVAIPGAVESIRPRLIKALETLGYSVVSEQPLHAQRRRQGAARCYSSVNALDYSMTVTVSLKQINDVSALVTFSYGIKSYIHLTEGDRETLAREAEAIAALATERMAVSSCPACGTQITDESHFCRRCGAPLVVEVPELEVLRLTRGARHSYHNIFLGIVAFLLASVTALLSFVVDGATIYAPLIWVGISLACYALFLLIQGMRQLHLTLNPKSLTKLDRPKLTFNASVTTALPPAPVNASVTEGTTELLSSKNSSRVVETVRRQAKTTGELDSDRLM